MSSSPLNLSLWAAEQEIEKTGFSLPAQIDPAHICTDTRQLIPGSIYLPLRGEQFDGHAFLEQALTQGADWAFCESAWYAAHPELAHLPLVVVPNTLQAYQSLARSWRRQLGLPVVAITGSSGKTSTKEILAQVLAPFENVHRTALNYNNEIGVPKTLLELTPDHSMCVVEMGMRGLGQIAELCAIAEPDLGIITNIGPVHLSELGSQANIAQAKWELAEALATRGRTVIINGDNAWSQRLAATHTGPVIRCGHSQENDWQIRKTQSENDGQWLTYRSPAGIEQRIWIDLEGDHQALNLLCCLAASEQLGHQQPPETRLFVPRLFGRQERHSLQGRVLINDAYNANPDSMRAALAVLAEQSPRRLAVLGKMAELGPEAPRFHAELGAYCESLGLDGVYVIGEEAHDILNGLQTVPGLFLADPGEAVTHLKACLQPGDTVLFKASRSAHLEKVLHPLVQYFAALAD
ncbi:MAG: UDP-N-acetylmuramoyl-tripeptide--D-alanyl-D-alanine ligase [Candidatus Sericytochromatia bacterium]